MASRKNNRTVRRGSSGKRTVCFGDTHVPQHDPAALRWALQATKELRPQKVILLGDMVDFLALSRFPKSPQQQLALQKELKAGRALIRTLEQALSKYEVVYILGNHEARPAKYLWKRAPELVDMPELAVPALLGVPNRWHIVPFGEAYLEQGALVIHGTRWGKTACQQYLSDYGMSVVAGHSHRLNLAKRRLPDGREITAVECGCLCKLKQNYSSINNWTHALAVIEGGKIREVQR